MPSRRVSWSWKSRRQLVSESRNKQGRGLYRAEIAGINARYARVSYVDHGEFDVSEEQYRAEGHKPDFDDLLSREEYDTANRPGARDRPEAAVKLR